MLITLGVKGLRFARGTQHLNLQRKFYLSYQRIILIIADHFLRCGTIMTRITQDSSRVTSWRYGFLKLIFRRMKITGENGHKE